MYGLRFPSTKMLRCMIALSLVAYVRADLKVGPYTLLAQQRPAARACDQSALDTVQIRDNVWVIFGAGGNVTVHVGEDGVMLVDSGSEAMAEKTLGAERAMSKATTLMIINTSADLEHVGGNDKVGAAGVPINPDNF